MQFSIATTALQNALAHAVSLIPKAHEVLPILSNVRIDADADGVTFTASNGEMAVVVRTAADVTEPGSITTPGHTFANYARELDASAPASISVVKGRLHLEQRRSLMKLVTLPADDYPALPITDTAAGWELDGASLVSMIPRTRFAVSTEESRPLLNGVLLTWGNGAVRMVATNGHRLAKDERALPSGTVMEDGHAVLPTKALELLARLISPTQPVRIVREMNAVVFVQPTVRVYTRVLEGRYPNWEGVVPADNDKLARFDREALIQSLRRVVVVANTQTSRIAIEFDGQGAAILTAETPDMGDSQDEVACQYTGGALRIGFNATYLLDVLKQMSTTEVELSLKAPERAGVVYEVADGTRNAAYLGLVMPLRLVD